jgi:tetratricopeptide (TPR) repeat protein
LIVLAAVMGVHPVGAEGSAIDANALAGWTGAAKAFLDAGNYDEAQELAVSGLEADPGNADFLFISAKAGYRSSGPEAGLVHPALDAVAAALASGRLSQMDRDAAITFQASLLSRLHRWNEALTLLGRLGPAPDAEAWLLKCSLLLAIGQRDAALLQFERAVASFPTDPGFPRLFFSSGAFSPGPRTERLAALWRRSFDRLSSADPDIVIPMLEALPSREARRNQLAAYRVMGGKAGIPELIEYGVLDFKAGIAEALPPTGQVELTTLRHLAGLLRDTGDAAVLAAALSGFSGSISEDADGDSFAEAVTTYDSGQPSSWRHDADQDGAFERALDFRYGEPATLSVAADGANWVFSYEGYPRLGAAVLDTIEGSRSVWILAPEVLALAPFRLGAVEGITGSFILPMATEARLPSESALAGAAVRLSVSTLSETLEIDLEGGKAVTATGYLSGGILSRIEYRDGRPLQERLDQDGDGRFESLLVLDPGSDPARPVVRETRSDIDGDGYAEFVELLGPPLTRSWDPDADGRVDIRETKLLDGSLRREFSSRGDGIFDESVLVSSDGTARAFGRGGRSIPVLPDSNPSIRWVGQMPFDLGPGFVPHEGEYEVLGIRYILYPLGKLWFAEVRP